MAAVGSEENASQQKILVDQIVGAVGRLSDPALISLRSKLDSMKLTTLRKIEREIRGSHPNEALDFVVEELDE
jgi:hypothetical protein